jgi:hypothetical protein
MFRAAAFAILSLPCACVALAAEPIGVPACDDFLTKYEACLTEKAPAAQRGAFKAQIEQLRASWTTLAKDPQTKPALESACKTSSDQMKTAVASYGCKF